MILTVKYIRIISITRCSKIIITYLKKSRLSINTICNNIGLYTKYCIYY